MPVSIDLINTDNEIRKMVIDEIVKQLNQKVKAATKDIKGQLSVLIENELRKTNVYIETQIGELNAMLGFHQGRERHIMDTIISVIASEVKIDFKPFRNNRDIVIDGGFEIYMIDADFKKALSHSLAFTNNDGQKLPWLKWLLLDGDVMIKGHRMLIKPTKYGRSKEAIMVDTFRQASFWKLPAEFSGIKELNWITKAFKGNTLDLDAVLSDIKIKMEHIVYSNIEKVL